MNRHPADNLAQFCAEQCLAFDTKAWFASDSFGRSTLKETARYLAKTSWYGHEEELEQIARQIAVEQDAGRSPGGSNEFADLAYFSAAVRWRIVALERKTIPGRSASPYVARESIASR